MAKPLLAELPPSVPMPHLLPPDGEGGRYFYAFARDRRQVLEVLRLRHRVFHRELGQGSPANARLGLDQDEFDTAFHHLMVVDAASDAAVGCYRLQTAEQAIALGRGWYSAEEFDLASLGTRFLAEAAEIGRACLHPEHRNGEALMQLWNGLVTYAQHNRKRHLFGCSSVPGADPHTGLAVLATLEEAGAMHPVLRATPLPRCATPANVRRPRTSAREPLPPLLASYLRLGAKVLGGPAIDHAFGTTDFLTTLDLETMAARTARFRRAYDSRS